MRPDVVLDILQNFTLFATDKKHRRIKVICRYQQYETTNKIVARVVAGYPKKGLIWHFQGSGKSLLMVFAAQKLRLHPHLGNPTVLIVVDRIDLDTQIAAWDTKSPKPVVEVPMEELISNSGTVRVKRFSSNANSGAFTRSGSNRCVSFTVC
jgi:type I restriction enzyme, R subunit